MIARIWHGWTTPVKADKYEAFVKGVVFKEIHSRKSPGFRSIELFRRNDGEAVEFVTLMKFDSLDAVRAFAGEDYEVAVVPAEGRAQLLRFDGRSQHYGILA